MFQAIQRRLQGKRDEGFTLIELMVVVLIISILIAIAIPTFLGARTRAQDRAAQSDLRNGVVSVETHYVDTESYTVTAAQLSAIEPEITFEDGGPVTTGNVGVYDDAVAGAYVVLVRESASGTFFCIHKDASTGTSYGSGANAAAVDTPAECAAASW
ncbi:MAG TPA: prepilin-type N-terminal cleavage/methylation domain-containing protein [Actinomycetota bacterium]